MRWNAVGVDDRRSKEWEHPLYVLKGNLMVQGVKSGASTNNTASQSSPSKMSVSVWIAASHPAMCDTQSYWSLMTCNMFILVH